MQGLDLSDFYDRIKAHDEIGGRPGTDQSRSADDVSARECGDIGSPPDPEPDRADRRKADHPGGLQRDALTEAGCQKIFTEQMSGAIYDRAKLAAGDRIGPPIITQLDTTTLLLLGSNRQSPPARQPRRARPSADGRFVEPFDFAAVDRKMGTHGATGLIDRHFRGINIFQAAIHGGQNGNNRYDTNRFRNDTKSLYTQSRTKNVGHW